MSSSEKLIPAIHRAHLDIPEILIILRCKARAFTISVTDRTGNADIKYTRNGAFTMTKEGHIVDTDGNHLMGESGEVIIPANAVDVIVDATGGYMQTGTMLIHS